MADNFIPGLQQARNCTIRRRRELPIRGTTLVQSGEIVSADAIVARAELPGDVQILRLSESMGIEARDVFAGLKVQVGDKVERGSLLCEHRGLFGFFKSQYKSAIEGTVDFISEASGHVGLRLPCQELKLNAYCGGRVCALTEGFSVEIETRATLIQGIFGVGGERQGIIRLLDIAADKIITKADLPSEVSGLIIAGGTCPDIGLLRHLAENKAAGLITGGIDDSALKEFLGYDIGLAVTGNEDIPFSLMITEGFGKLAMSERVLGLLRSGNNQMACMNGCTQIRAGAIRPEVIIPEINQSQSVPSFEASNGLSPGSRVRLIRVPYFGQLGKVIELTSGLQKLETGAYARVLKVQLDSGKEVSVPRANAELII